VFFTSIITGTITALGLLLGSVQVANDAPEADAPEVPAAKAVPEGLERVEADVARCRTAAEAVLVYRLFVADDGLPEDVKAAAAERLAELQALAGAAQARVGEGWGSAAEAAEASRNAADEVDHAFELLRLGNGKLAKEALDKAARLDPFAGRSRFAAGLVYAVLNDPAKARVSFAEASAVEPDNGPAFNNLAVCELLSRRSMQAVEHFRSAAGRLTNLQPLADNVALAIRLAATPRGKMPEKALGECNDLLRWLGRDQGLVPAEGVMTYTLLSWDGRPCREQSATLAGYVPRQRARTVAGVVVAADRVLVPAGIVQKEWALAVADPHDPKKQIPAEVIAVLEQPGLALLRCDGLDTAPLPLAAAVPDVGTEVLAVGAVVPGTGRGWDVSRGAIVRPPEDHGFIHRGGVARGLGGGPVVDPSGRGVGIVAAMPRTEAIGLGHGMAIPVETLWPWLRDHLPGLEAAGAGDPSGWEEVSQNARQATVAVLQVPLPPIP
jgi:Flp pilus assembly protein TadD